MSLYKVCAVLLVALCAVCFSENPEDKVHHHTATNEEHFNSDGEVHNPEFDHEAFAGEESASFPELSPEDAKIKLRVLAMKVDVDGNGRVTRAELTTWITRQMNRYAENDADQQWKSHNTNEDASMTWEEYKSGTYGMEEANDETLTDILKRDRVRYERADGNSDGVLSREEFSHYLHPEGAEHMRPLVVQETLDDLDKNKDGFLTLEEYLGEIHTEEDGSEPEWMASERDQFTEQRDTNKDGKLDKEEVAKWILPQDAGQASEEVDHLMSLADDDKDDELTIEEIVDHQDVFVGSQATNYGSLLREEL